MVDSHHKHGKPSYVISSAMTSLSSHETMVCCVLLHIYEFCGTAGWIYTIWSSMELSRTVVVQHHGHLTLTVEFQGQILKMLYLCNGRADWHGTKGMWIDRMLDPHCDFELWPLPWPWPLIFKVKFWISCNSGTGCPIDMEQMGCESTECGPMLWLSTLTSPMTVTLNFQCQISK